MEYASSTIIESGSLLTHNAMREWIVRTFNRHKGVVTELLGHSLSRINVSSEAWTSRSLPLSLASPYTFLKTKGNFARFCSAYHESRAAIVAKALLAELLGPYPSSEIIYEYGFEGRVGYFVTDNAESNDPCLEELATELGSNRQHHQLRCCGHIINLVARSILFGTDADAFEEDCLADKGLQDKMRLWRAKRPISKLHNIIHLVQTSDQRIDKLHKLRSIKNTALGLDDRSTYDMITDNATLWKSSEAMMERCYQLRNPLGFLVQEEVTEWDHLLTTTSSNEDIKYGQREASGRAFDVQTTCTPPKLVYRCFQQEEIVPLQAASKEETASAFLQKSQDRSPKKRSRRSGPPPLLSSTKDSISRRPQAARQSSRSRAQPCPICWQRDPSMGTSLRIVSREIRPQRRTPGLLMWPTQSTGSHLLLQKGTAASSDEAYTVSKYGSEPCNRKRLQQIHRSV
ncbi:hypothetical protein FANTH_14791 [Fusarium anthophilum]|uniref:Transposase n=1 Tax=Fusarium anthophilum TaxID=48485 RepID=A0A8H4YFJ7_9HYPO|nr:hypothetical protein FANTH_14791 [Fusarium anthophilum]